MYPLLRPASLYKRQKCTLQCVRVFPQRTLESGNEEINENCSSSCSSICHVDPILSQNLYVTQTPNLVLITHSASVIDLLRFKICQKYFQSYRNRFVSLLDHFAGYFQIIPKTSCRIASKFRKNCTFNKSTTSVEFPR